MELIVALIDFSQVASDVVTLAGQLARTMSSKLILLHVAMPDAEFVGDQQRRDVSRQGIARELRHRHRDMEILEMEMKKLGIDAVGRMVRGESVRGNPARKIVEELERLAPDLVVLGYAKRGRMHRLLWDGVADTVMRKARRPVLLVPNPARGRTTSPTAANIR